MPHRALVLSLSLPLAVALVAPPSAAWAAGRGDRAKAKRFEKKGKKAYKKGKYGEAISAFELAYEAHAEPKHLHNIARAHEKLGDYVTAIDYAERYVAAETDEREREDGEETLQILKGQLRQRRGHVVLATAPPGAVARLRTGDEQVDGRTPLSKWLLAGAWSATLTLDGHEPLTKEFVVEAGEELELEYSFAGEGATPEAASASKAEGMPRVPASDSTPQRRHEASGTPWGFWTLAAGAAVLAGGAVFGLLAGQAKDDREAAKDMGLYSDFRDANSRVESHTSSANLLLATGGGMVLTGAVLAFVW